MEKELKEIIITKNTCISFPEADSINGDILILGNYNGICGDVKWDGKSGICEIAEDFCDMNGEIFFNNMNTLITALRNKHKIVFVGSSETIKYFKNLFYAAGDRYLYLDYNKNELKKMFNKYIHTIDITSIFQDTFIKYKVSSKYRKNLAQVRIDEVVMNKIFKQLEGMKFDTIIQNPPYNKSLHLDFFEKGLDLLTDTGRMVIIEPATWLINVRKNGKAKTYDAIKQRINGHIESVIIENLNNEFNTRLYTPFSIVTIDMSKAFDAIDFTCCGETRKVKSVYDCNLVGDYATIWSIFEKVQSFGDMMKAHTTKENMGNNMFYLKFIEIIGGHILGCGGITERGGTTYDSPSLWGETINGNYANGYISVCNHYYNNSISNTPHCAYDAGKHLTDKITDNIYGTKEELENWKHFIFNNKLSLFLNIVLTIDQNNNSKDFLPWLVDKQYTDDEINKLFGFTDEEIKLIDTTIKKYERNSPWFKRYMCGKDAVTDEEVNNFIAEISK
jgi:hypothetical protein